MDTYEKHYCNLCGKEIIFDCKKPLPIIGCGNKEMYYCSDHAEVGMEIFNKFYAEKRKFGSNYYDEEYLLNKIESQYKSNIGDWFIQFPNLRNYGEEILNAPIIKDDKPIGFISNVTPSCVSGRIWSKYIPIVEEIAADNNRTMSFEMVC